MTTSLDQFRAIGTTAISCDVHVKFVTTGVLIDRPRGFLPNESTGVLLLYAWAGEWVRLGCPCLEVLPAQVTRLTTTKPPASAQPPWPFYAVQLPDGALTTVNTKGVRVSLELIAVMYSQLHDCWSFVAMGDNVELWQQHRSPAYLHEPNLNDHPLDPQRDLGGMGVPWDTNDAAVMRYIGWLLLNSCNFINIEP